MEAEGSEACMRIWNKDEDMSMNERRISRKCPVRERDVVSRYRDIVTDQDEETAR